MNLAAFLREVRTNVARVWPDARFLSVEDLPFYHKLRIFLTQDLFVEIRANARNKRISYALVQNEKRIAGFDNLGAWHIHPFENPDAHRRVAAPSPKKVFAYFNSGIALQR